MPDADTRPVIAVIGGGPAGLMAAGTAAAHGAHVMLFEKNPQCGRKLLLTGSGKCNITNSAPFHRFLEHYPENSRFLYSAFQQYFVEELKALFLQYRLPLVLEESGKYFPETRSALSVLEVLQKYDRDQGVELHVREPMLTIASHPSGWTLTTDRCAYRVDAVILATGGRSYPKTGSDGDGYRMAANLSHTVVPLRPALVPLVVARPECGALSGVSLQDVPVELWVMEPDTSTRLVATQRGDLLFTHFGVSGPAVLFLSRWLPADFDRSNTPRIYELKVDLLPTLTLPELEERLLRIFGSTPNRQLKTVLGRELQLPLAVAGMIVMECGLSEDISCHEITKEFRKRLRTNLKSLRFSISGTRGFREAMATAGGVSTLEIHPRTMESKLHPGLYFAGEVIDIDGFTGGYNLQAAFSTGYLAGRCAAGGRMTGRRSRRDDSLV